MHKKLIAAVLATAFFTTPAFAKRNVQGSVNDNYKQVIDRNPYTVEVCTDVNVRGDRTGDTIMGAIIGGAIGNNVTKNLPDGGTAGAILGGLLGNMNSDATGGIQRQCNVETRYKEVSKEVYSHSVITFTLDGQTYTVRFNRS
jgi:uncharacterized protein YcfJ|tara:strand:- start:360 stop:788 length:429 start_codon:yes stop_codon:yes gene_type:complete